MESQTNPLALPRQTNIIFDGHVPVLTYSYKRFPLAQLTTQTEMQTFSDYEANGSEFAAH